jgi:peptide/nickel transport system ATP-binding protein/oligopeptide transport system ATP-binding protein
MNLVEARDLTKVFRARSGGGEENSHVGSGVHGVSFDIAIGETLAIVGESGAGKSTTARLLLRLVEPDAGSIMFDGADVLRMSRKAFRPLRRHMQMIFQNPYNSLDPRLPVGTSIGEPMLVHFGASRTERRGRALELLDRVGLDRDLYGRLPAELSGGQLQRVAIARALSIRPKLIVCDEPVAALDVSMRAQVINLMRDVQQEYGLSYLFISHDLALVEVLADRVAVMLDGRIVEMRPTAAVFADPQHEYTKDLLAAIPSRVPHDRRTHRTSTPIGVVEPDELAPGELAAGV